MRSAAVTIVSGRHRHLLAQRASVRASAVPFDVHVVVALGDPWVAAVLTDEHDPPLVLVELPADTARLPLAAGRNAGAAAAIAAGAELLVFLDVDCLAGADLLGRYVDAARRRPDALLCGPVTYLTADQSTDPRPERHRSPHPGRPDPAPGDLVDGDHELFWSLSFALTPDAWTRIGGFDEGYAGYGAEDTDFGMRAARAGVGLVWVGAADAYHQHHATHSPPAQHVDDIVRNGARYAARWGTWPMTGWLDRLAELGLVHRTTDGWTRAARLRVASVPERHPYVEAVTPAIVDPAATGRTTGWEPDPLLTEDHLRAVAGQIDVVHVHFGFEHVSPAGLARWLDVLRELGIPLVVTVHDLRNPHLADNVRHEEQLRLLLAAAAVVVTLTAGAAARIESDHGRSATVVPHPTVLDDLPLGDPASRTVLVPLGALRANVQDVGALLDAVVAGAARAGARVLVDLRPGRDDDPRAIAVHTRAAAGRLDVVVGDRRTEAALAAHLAAARVLVLPYRFGTHSGWLELARDLGVRAVVPTCGCYAEQAGDGAETYDLDERHGLAATTLTDAVARALDRPRPATAERSARLAERAHVRATHEIVFRRALRR